MLPLRLSIHNYSTSVSQDTVFTTAISGSGGESTPAISISGIRWQHPYTPQALAQGSTLSFHQVAVSKGRQGVVFLTIPTDSLGVMFLSLAQPKMDNIVANPWKLRSAHI